jgi:site-specific DNA-methyltransferase (adenine-specific)
MSVELLNVNCMDFMATLPDNAFDLAIVDPPYGVGDKFKGGKSGKMQFNEIPDKGWDVAPEPIYFSELFRVSKNQIIWGGNYYDLPPTRCFLVWDKLISPDFSLAMAEFGWTSFDALAKIYRMGTPKDGGKIHPTQKPVKLYKCLLTNYAKPGQRILDTHLGSGSSAIAAHNFGFDFVGCELDKEYYDAAVCRFNKATAQISMF